MIVGRARKEKFQDIVRDIKKYTSVQICRALESSDNDKWLLKYFKNATDLSSKHIKYEFWINDYHPIELNYNSIMEQKLEYIHNYPVKRTAG